MRSAAGTIESEGADVGGGLVNQPQWIPDGIDLTRPSASRVYDYYLGGYHNFEVDREMARTAIADWPDLPKIMRENRAFLRRAVTYLSGIGVRQFLDIGSGIPTVGNVHEIVGRLDPGAAVAYVDIDPVAVAHSQAILDANPCAVALRGDFRRPQEILEHEMVTGLLDLDRPVALLLVSLLHFVGDDDNPGEVIETFRKALAPGSHLVIAHATQEVHPPELTASHRALYRKTATPMTMRGRAEVEALFAGFDLVPPGVVLIDRWRPENDDVFAEPEWCPVWGGIGRRS